MSSDGAGGALPTRVGVARTSDGPEILAAYGDRVVSLTAALGWDHCSTADLIRRWDELAPRLAEVGETAPQVDLGAVTWEPPMMPRKLLCVGANYTDHVEEMERAGAPKVEGDPVPVQLPQAADHGAGRQRRRGRRSPASATNSTGRRSWRW